MPRPLTSMLALCLLGARACLACSEDGASRGRPGTHVDASTDASSPSEGGARESGAPVEREAGAGRDARSPLPEAAVGSDGATPHPPDARADAAPDVDAATTPPDAATVPDGAPVPPPGYPLGPYGSHVGDTVPPLVWEGYVNDAATGLASDQPYGPYSMDALRRSGKPWLLLHVSDFDCPGCNNAANDLATQGKSVVDAGGAVVEVLGSHGFFFAATKDYLDAWVTTHDLPVTSVIDAPGHELESLQALGVRETVVIVDLSTMKVVWRLTGDLGGVDPSSIGAATTEILARLP